MSGEIPEELNHHNTDRCSYACWSTEPRVVLNATAYGVRSRSRWARTSHSVELVANTVLGCSCSDSGICKHIEHVIEIDTRGCIEYNPTSDRNRIEELKEFTRTRRKLLYNPLRARS